MTLAELAEYLPLHEDTILGWAREGYLPGHQDSVTLIWQFDRNEIDDFVESCRIVPGTVVSGRPWGKGTP